MSTNIEMDKVSVVLPTYNRVKLLEGAVESVLNQSHRNFELIVVDDGSTDSTKEYLSSISDERLEPVSLEENVGRSEARNIGIQHSTGDYIAFIDDDDRWVEKKLEEQLNQLGSLPDSYCGTYSWGVVKSSDEVINILKPTEDGDLYPEILVDDFIYPFTSLLVKTEVMSEIGEFDTRFPQAEDWDFCIRLAKKGRIACIRKPLVTIFKHGDNVTTDHNHATISRQLIWDKYSSEICSNSLNKQYKSIWERQKAIECLNRANHRLAITHMLQSCKYNRTFQTAMFLFVALLGPKSYKFLSDLNSKFSLKSTK